MLWKRVYFRKVINKVYSVKKVRKLRENCNKKIIMKMQKMKSQTSERVKEETGREKEKKTEAETKRFIDFY